MKTLATINVDDTVTFSEVDQENEYKFLSAAVGGYIQAVPLQDPVGELTMWLNEEGKLDGLPENMAATWLWGRSYGATDVMVGNVVLSGGVDENGETLGLSDDQVAALQSMFRLDK